MGDPALEEFCFWFAGADGEGVAASFVYDGNLLVSTKGAHNMSTLFIVIEPSKRPVCVRQSQHLANILGH